MATSSTRKTAPRKPQDHQPKRAYRADDLDNETGDEFVVSFDDVDFTVPNIARGRTWRETASILASLSGERGILQMQSSLEDLLGDQIEATEDWDFTKLMQFAMRLGERLGEAIGTPGK